MDSARIVLGMDRSSGRAATGEGQGGGRCPPPSLRGAERRDDPDSRATCSRSLDCCVGPHPERGEGRLLAMVGSFIRGEAATQRSLRLSAQSGHLDTVAGRPLVARSGLSSKLI